MSDHVSYVAGNTKGRDHIQWPTATRTQLDDPGSAPSAILGVLSEDQRDQFWPVDVTLLQIMALCWKVRRWTLDGACSVNMVYTPDVGGPFHFTGVSTVDATEMVTFAGASEATRERDLVGQVIFANTTPYKCLVNGGVGAKPGADLTSDWSTTSDLNGDFTGSTPMLFNMLAGFHLFDEITKKFAPPIQTFGNLIPASGGFNQLILNVTPHRHPVTAESVIGPEVLKAPGLLTVKPGIVPDFEVPLQLSWRLQFEQPGSALSGSGSGTFTLEATDFWTY